MYNAVIIGGGIIGIASALKIKEKNPKYKVAVIEKEQNIAQHQTGHNSGVIHSGIYYPPNSLKATNCTKGYNMLLKFCEEEEIPYKICGKIIVATNPEQKTMLKTLYDRGIANGLKGMQHLSVEELKEYEPHVNGLGGIRIPQTGVIDYKKVVEKYAEKFLHFGGEIYSSSKVLKFKEDKDFINVHTKNKNFITRVVVNCAGLYSDKVAKLTGAKIHYRIIPFRGEYYKLSPNKEHLVKNLIYPVPDPKFPFLGVHFTRQINGGVEVGPNAVLAFAREGYKKSNINFKEFAGSIFCAGFLKMASKHWKTGTGELYRSFSKTAFTSSIQKIIPEIQKKDLVKGGSGVRAQALSKKNGLIDDFLVVKHKKFVNVVNAPSPAATASLAIGEKVAYLTIERLMK